MFDIYKKDYMRDIKKDNKDLTELENDARLSFKDKGSHFLIKKDGKWVIKRKTEEEMSI